MVHNRVCTCCGQIHVALKLMQFWPARSILSFVHDQKIYVFELIVKSALNHLNYQILKQGESNQTGFEAGRTIPTFLLCSYISFHFLRKCPTISTFSL